jgi:hypothetical protein
MMDAENYIKRSFIFCILHKLLYKIKVDEIGGACSTHRADETCIDSFSLRTRRKEAITWEV